MSGMSWDGICQQWRSTYSSLVVVTIAEKASHKRSFSADTGMAECLFVGTKSAPHGEPRATFVILSRQPKTTLEGELIAQAITNAIGDVAFELWRMAHSEERAFSWVIP